MVEHISEDGTSSTAERRHSNEFTSPPADASVEFRARRGEWRYQQLLQAFAGCPVCGGHRLLPPDRAQRGRIPEAAGVCADCESALMLSEGGEVRVLRERTRT
jgi:hypothetical protein